MATIAYLRVSTEGQDLDQQRLAILDYAQKHRVIVDTFVETQRSSQHATQRAELLQMIEGLHPGDRVIVSELSRFGRSLSQILQMIDRLIQKEVRLVAIKEAIRFEGKHNIQTKAMIALFGLFAELERDLIAERTKEGLAAAKARGKRLGRPKGALSTSKLDGSKTTSSPSCAKRSPRPLLLGSWRFLRQRFITLSRAGSFSPRRLPERGWAHQPRGSSAGDHHESGSPYAGQRQNGESNTCKNGLKKLGRGLTPALGGLSGLRQPWQRAECPCDQQLVTDLSSAL